MPNQPTAQTHEFANRHFGSDPGESLAMAQELGCARLEALIDATVPAAIRARAPLHLPEPLAEREALEELRGIMSGNRLLKNFIGQGYYGTLTPPVLQRNIMENPGWYTAYTPYQAEIAQGRLEALLNFQTMVTEMTGLPIANASLLDEGTAAAEAAALCLASPRVPNPRRLLVDEDCFPQTISVIAGRMEPLGIEVSVVDCFHAEVDAKGDGTFAVVLQYPGSSGRVREWTERVAYFQNQGVRVIFAADLLALTLLKSPGEMGADIAVGTTQRFGVPMGFGGPHAAYMAVRDELKRKMPGRLVGVSVDAHGKPACRLSLQTREQHIRREKATSNICTAQVLLAVMAGMYAAWHGPEGLREIASRTHDLASRLAAGLRNGGLKLACGEFFDTLSVHLPGQAENVRKKAEEAGMNFRVTGTDMLGISFDETHTEADARAILSLFGLAPELPPASPALPAGARRTSSYLNQEVFRAYHSEHEMLRYLHRLEMRDLTLTESMIALGSCTMKLNATAEMMPLSWPEVNSLHPYAPKAQAAGYHQMCSDLEKWLAEITGFDATSLQPNAGSQGEYAGLLAIRSYHRMRGDMGRTICLIPTSAHGTNPASAVMAGMKVVAVACDDQGNINLTDLETKARAHAAELAALMVTYPSTHGVFEEGIRDVCRIIHENGGQVYMDGANMNAQVGLTSPGLIGADVCHLNLHKTFCIPHGGGGPGVGPICVKSHLQPHLPALRPDGSGDMISSAPYGSASILTISWMYIRMMGATGLTEATKRAILSANYVAHRLHPYFPVLYKGTSGFVAHECIIDLRQYKESAGVSVEDVAKRLIDYGFHSPTMSWPVAGTLMIEPTESESRKELDKFCDAMISIHGEIRAIETGESDRANNPLKHAPHTAASLLVEDWDRPYTRESAAFPDDAQRLHKYWPPVGRIDNVHGDKHLVCTCPSVEEMAEFSSLDKRRDVAN